MNRPPLEVADIVRCAGQSFIERSRKWINGQHEKVLLAIARVCPVFCVNDQAFLVLLLFLGMGCKGRGQFPFPCVHVEKS